MKKIALYISLVLFTWGCADNEGEYIDVRSGKTVMLKKDDSTGYMVNAETNRPVYIYTDPVKKDTFYGRTGKNINGRVVINGGTVSYDGDDEYIYKDGDYKKKSDDGDYKIKDGDYKKKVEADGDIKIKDGDYKKKVSENGEVKIKDGDTKIKISANGEKKVKRD